MERNYRDLDFFQWKILGSCSVLNYKHKKSRNFAPAFLHYLFLSIELRNVYPIQKHLFH